MKYPSYIEISKSALQNNFDFLKQQYGDHVRISSVVKANAYGHGITQFVPLVEASGIDHFSVFSMDEALKVKHSLKNHADIMVMGWTHPDDMEWGINNGIELYVFEPGVLINILSVAKRIKKAASIHLEVETGMNRTGLNTIELKKVVKLINDNRDLLKIRGVCTHYAGAESISNYVRIKSQIQKFNRKDKWLAKLGIVPEYKHTACSAASIAYPQTRMDMVRIGILQYGFWPSPETFLTYTHGKQVKDDPLNRVISWKSTVMSTKDVNEGEFVSYGTTYLAKRNMRIAVIPTGYSHGYSRSLSNQGRVLIQGQRVGVVGLINMNMLIADISELDGVEIGDEVVFIGKQGEHEITVGSFVEFSDQMNYELLARLPQSIPRTVVD